MSRRCMQAVLPVLADTVGWPASISEPIFDQGFQPIVQTRRQRPRVAQSLDDPTRVTGIVFECSHYHSRPAPSPLRRRVNLSSYTVEATGSEVALPNAFFRLRLRCLAVKPAP